MAVKKTLSAKQANWFEKVRAGIETDTGVTFKEWVNIAKTCPETTHQKRLRWFKEQHGLGMNRASTIISAAFEADTGWSNPEAMLNGLWKKPELREIYDGIESYAVGLGDDVIVGPRKTFSGFSRNYQFAAARPVRNSVRLGIAVDPTEFGLEASSSSDSWSDRVASVVVITNAKEFNATVKKYLKTAWKNG